MTKEELRKIYLQKRRLTSDAEYEKLSIQISENFFNQVDLSSVKALHIFIPIKKNKEPNTVFIIERLQKKFSNISLVVPRVNHNTEEMENFRFEGFQQLEKNKWDILEPKGGKQIEPQDIDMVLIPLLAFDAEGHRVGY
jgi:5-formyltetrahydrofolate cyclo-ligase